MRANRNPRRETAMDAPGARSIVLVRCWAGLLERFVFGANSDQCGSEAWLEKKGGNQQRN